MLKQLLSSILVSTLVGCASSPSYTSVYDQIIIGNKQTPDDYSYIDDKSLSQEMQFMYYIGNSDVKPIKANDLDNFAKDYNPHAVSDASLVGASVITLLGGANIFQLGTFGLGNLGGRVDMDMRFKENKIIKLIPVKENLTKDEFDTIYNNSIKETTAVIKAALAEESKTLVKDVYFDNDNVIQTSFFIAANEQKQTPDCSTKEVNEYGRIGGNGFCSSSLFSMFSKFRTNLDLNNQYLPKGAFIVYEVTLDPGFPVENLKFDSEYSYLYMAPFSKYLDYRIKAYNRTDEQWKDIYEQGRLSMFPYIKNLKNGDINYFNKKLTSLQKDKKTPII